MDFFIVTLEVVLLLILRKVGSGPPSVVILQIGFVSHLT